MQPERPGRISRCDLGGGVWAWTNGQGDVPQRIIAIVAADQTKSATGNDWWILGADGLYQSNDSGATLRKMLKP